MQTRLLTSMLFLMGGAIVLVAIPGCTPEGAELSDQDGMQNTRVEDEKDSQGGEEPLDKCKGSGSSDNSKDSGKSEGSEDPDSTEPDEAEHPSGQKPAAPAPLAEGIRVEKVVLYQGVAIPLMNNGQAVEQRRAPVVQDRDAMLRVHVAPLSNYAARELVAELSFEGTNAPEPQRLTKLVRAASSEDDLSSTFNFDIPGAHMTGDASVHIAIRETSAEAVPNGSPSPDAEWPQAGTMHLGAQSSNGDLELVIVPIRYTGDSSGRMPDTSAGHLAKMRDRFNATYPAPDTKISVRSAIDFSEQFSRNGTGWSRLLNQVCAARQQDRPGRNVHYYGLIAPSSSFSAYCGGSCVTGLANVVTDANDDYARCSIGIGFGDDRTIETALHEIGHTFGRHHAPCGNPSGVDRSFPYPGGSIGTWGYDLTHKQLRDPSTHKDFLAYCNPMWVSDYTYSALFDRLSYVNGRMSFYTSTQTTTTFRVALIDGEGGVEWGEPIELRSAPTGEEHELAVFDEDGESAGTLKGYFYEYSHLPGGTMLIPEPRSKTIRAIEVPSNGAERLLRF